MSLVPGNLPLKMRRGSSFGPISIFCKDGLGAAFNLTGYSAFAVARSFPLSSSSLDLSPAITPGITGEIVIEFTDEETQRDFPPGEYEYDLVLETPGGVRGAPIIAGKLTVIDENTRH